MSELEPVIPTEEIMNEFFGPLLTRRITDRKEYSPGQYNKWYIRRLDQTEPSAECIRNPVWILPNCFKVNVNDLSNEHGLPIIPYDQAREQYDQALINFKVSAEENVINGIHSIAGNNVFYEGKSNNFINRLTPSSEHLKRIRNEDAPAGFYKKIITKINETHRELLYSLCPTIGIPAIMYIPKLDDQQIKNTIYGLTPIKTALVSFDILLVPDFPGMISITNLPVAPERFPIGSLEVGLKEYESSVAYIMPGTTHKLLNSSYGSSKKGTHHTHQYLTKEHWLQNLMR